MNMIEKLPGIWTYCVQTWYTMHQLSDRTILTKRCSCTEASA